MRRLLGERPTGTAERGVLSLYQVCGLARRHGDVELTVDLSQARLEDIDEATRCATLVLPDPIPSRPRLDHERTRIYQIDRTGLWQIVPGQAAEAKLVDAAMAEAQRTLERAAQDPKIIQRTRAHAARLLQDAAASLGWTLEVR